MNIIIVGGLGHDYIQLEKWLPVDPQKKYYFLVKEHHFKDFEKALNGRKDIHLVSIHDWYNSNEIELYIYKFNQKNKIDRLLSLREEEVTRISKVREALDIPGLRPRAAVLFRNKHLMKKFIRENGIKTADDSLVDSFYDALQFIKDSKYKFPFILKPVDGAGSRDTFVINNLDDLEKIDSQYFKNAIIENFIEGDVFHIDILFTQNTLRYISAARYINSPIAFKKGKSSATMFLTSDNEDSKNMKQFGKTVCSLMPLPDNCIIHLEAFKNKKGIYFNEIAIRFGGGKILDTIEKEFHFNLLGEYIRAEAGFLFTRKAPLEWHKPRGIILVVPKKGKIKSIPTHFSDENIDLCEVYAKPGMEYTDVNSSVLALAAIEVHAKDNEALEKKIIELDKKFKEEVKYF